MRRVALFGFALLLLVTVGAAVGLSALTSGGESADATITTFEPRVAVGNESADALSGSGEVVTCNDRGPMPGNAGLSGRLLVERPVADEGPREASFRLVVTVGDGLFTDSLNATLTPGGSTRSLLFTVVDQPEELSGGDEVTVSARVELTNGTAVASAERVVDVAERDRPCADEREN
jgi:hypothetical protein